MAIIGSTLRTLKGLTRSAWVVGRQRVRGLGGPASWSLSFEIAVEYLRRDVGHRGALTHPEYRRKLEAIQLPDPALRGVTVSEAVIGGCRVEILRPKEAPPGRTILYFHGGSYHHGSALTHRPLTTRLAAKAAAQVIVVDYRLAPEDPFPAALDDAVAVYRGLTSEGWAEPYSTVIAGDSAGGGLTGALLLALRSQEMIAPAGAVMICPWVDLAARGGSMIRNAKSDWIDSESIDGLARSYAGEASLEDPWVSPTYGIAEGDPQALPPILVQVGSLEILVDQVHEFVIRAQAAGVQIELKLWDDMVHDWHLLANLDRRGAEAIEEIADFARRVTA